MSSPHSLATASPDAVLLDMYLPGMSGLELLSFDPPGGDGPITVVALMVRKDPDSQAYAFVNLTNADFTRLKNFVDSRLPG